MDAFFGWFGLPGTFVLTVLLSLLALTLALIFRTRDRTFAAAAMLVCSLGDLVMTNFGNIRRFLPFPGLYLGAALFIVGHLLYIAAFASLIRKNRYPVYTRAFGMGVVLTAAVFAAVVVFMVTGDTFPGAAMAAVCGIYACVIGASLSLIWSYAYSERTVRSVAAAGVLVFFLSDLIIGMGALCQVNQFDSLIWWLYPIGQLLLILCA